MKNYINYDIKTFLVEIGTEELPPKELPVLAQNFANNIINECYKLKIEHGNVHWFATSRRLAVKIINLNILKNIKKVNQSSSKSNNNYIKNINKLSVYNQMKISDKIINYIIYDKNINFLKKKIIINEIIEKIFFKIINNSLKLPIIKMMRWGDNNFQFIRPIRTITILLDNKHISGNLFGINIGRIIRGHRFMGESEIQLDHADNYLNKLLKHGKVIADYKLRRKLIVLNIKNAAKCIDGVTDINDNNLIEELTSLVEWPVIITGHFDKSYLLLPNEILIHIIKNEQKCLPVYNTNGQLLPYFIGVSNIFSENMNKIILGNEKVIKARLEDAKFFLNSDRKFRLEEHLSKLDKILFHEKLGTLLERSYRIQSLSGWIASKIKADINLSKQAGILSKCDLMTKMVFEYPNIQGIIGMHYARFDGLPEEVALAQKEQYQPRFSGDNLPTTLVSCAVAISDKIDFITGIFGIGLFPKGNKDPFALRRSALGILRIIIEKKLQLDLQILTKQAIHLYEKKITNTNIIKNIVNFTLNRFPYFYQERNEHIELDTIQAVLACRPTRPIDFDSRVRAVNYFRTLDIAITLSTINKRVLNILNKSNDLLNKEINPFLLKEIEEIKLANHFKILQNSIKPLFEKELYKDILIKLSSIHEPLDLFFKNVMVMEKNNDIRINRLTLLSKIRNTFLQIADISLLQKK